MADCISQELHRLSVTHREGALWLETVLIEFFQFHCTRERERYKVDCGFQQSAWNCSAQFHASAKPKSQLCQFKFRSTALFPNFIQLREREGFSKGKGVGRLIRVTPPPLRLNASPSTSALWWFSSFNFITTGAGGDQHRGVRKMWSRRLVGVEFYPGKSSATASACEVIEYLCRPHGEGWRS